jgi:endo-1,4-beta-mannosidase
VSTWTPTTPRWTCPPGRHTITVSATNGGPVGQTSATFRLDAHVLREGDHLTMNGQPWRFIGLQTPDLRELAFQANLGGTDRVPEVLDEAKRLGVRVLRVPACDDRPNAPDRDSDGPRDLQRVGPRRARPRDRPRRRRGFKLLLPLVDASDALGGINQYLRWNGYVVPIVGDKRFFFEPGPIREHFKNHVRALLGRVNSVNGIRYSDDPAILGWEIFTSADALGVYDVASAGAETADFVADLTQVIKAAAPGALAGTGEMGHDVNPSLYGRSADPFREVGLNGLFDASHGLAWQRNLRAGTVDFGGIQVIPDLLGFAGDPILYANLGAEWIRGHAALAATNSKPFIVTLAAENMVILAPETRRQALSAWLDELTARGFTGFVVGNFHADGFDRRADPHGFSWAENTDAADPQNELVPLVQTAASRLNGP